VREQLSRGEAYATAPRSDWESFDPQLIAEALFATANIFSILKLIHFCTISSHLGPLQLTLGRLVNDVAWSVGRSVCRTHWPAPRKSG